jgi:hypothetical protein
MDGGWEAGAQLDDPASPLFLVLAICSSMISVDQKSQWKIRCFLNSNSWRHVDARYMVAVFQHL